MLMDTTPKPDRSIPTHESEDQYSAHRVIVIGDNDSIAAIVNRWQLGLQDLAPDFSITIRYQAQPGETTLASDHAPINLGTALEISTADSHIDTGMKDVNIDITRVNPKNLEQNFTHQLQITRIGADRILQDVVPDPIKYTIEKTGQIMLCAKPEDAIGLLSLMNALLLLNPDAQITVAVYSAERKPLGKTFSEIRKKAKLILIYPDTPIISVQPILPILNKQLQDSSDRRLSEKGLVQKIVLESWELQRYH